MGRTTCNEFLGENLFSGASGLHLSSLSYTLWLLPSPTHLANPTFLSSFNTYCNSRGRGDAGGVGLGAARLLRVRACEQECVFVCG